MVRRFAIASTLAIKASQRLDERFDKLDSSSATLGSGNGYFAARSQDCALGYWCPAKSGACRTDASSLRCKHSTRLTVSRTDQRRSRWRPTIHAIDAEPRNFR